MSAQTPESYQPGIEYIESLNTTALREWLHAELHEKVHVLAGQADDYTVQAILNHHRYLSQPAQKRFAEAIEALILEWRRAPEEWTESAVRALLNLSAELPVPGAKQKLQALISSAKGMAQVPPTVYPAIFRTLAALASNEDRAFWLDIPLMDARMAGLAFQVLARIAPDDAIKLLARLPSNDEAVSGVSRSIGRFVSQFAPERRDAVLNRISEATANLDPAYIAELARALSESGFELPLRPSGGSWIAGHVQLILSKVGLAISHSSIALGGGSQLAPGSDATRYRLRS